jgi:hypothetical protein
MSHYATEKMFGGQRVSVGLVVLEGVPDEPGLLEVAFVVGVDQHRDVPMMGVELLGDSFSATYFDAKTEDDLERMPKGSWCWPPRV